MYTWQDFNILVTNDEEVVAIAKLKGGGQTDFWLLMVAMETVNYLQRKWCIDKSILVQGMQQQLGKVIEYQVY